MGIYIYAVRAGGARPVVLNGATETAYPLVYLYKPYYEFLGDLDKGQQRAGKNVERAWDRRGLHPHGMLVFGATKEGKPYEGSEVRRWSEFHPFWCDADEDTEREEYVGYLVREGRGWRVEPETLEQRNERLEAEWRARSTPLRP